MSLQGSSVWGIGGGGSIMFARKAMGDDSEEEEEEQTHVEPPKSVMSSSNHSLDSMPQPKKAPVVYQTSSSGNIAPSTAPRAQIIEQSKVAKTPADIAFEEEKARNRMIFGAGIGVGSEAISRKMVNSRENVFIGEGRGSTNSAAGVHTPQRRDSRSSRAELSLMWPGSTPIVDILAAIGVQRGWSPDEVQTDAIAFANQRIRTVDDLRAISKDTWDSFTTVLPIVKDLLRQEIARAVL